MTASEKRVCLNALRVYRNTLEKRIAHTRTRLLHAIDASTTADLERNLVEYRQELDHTKNLIQELQ